MTQRNYLFTSESEMRQLFERFLVERFVVPELADYSLGAELDREALSAGHPMPA